MDQNGIIDDIYEAAFLPELWPTVLLHIGKLSSSAAGAMFIFDEDRPIRFRATGLVQPEMESFADRTWRENERLRVFRTKPFTGFVVAHDYFTPEFLVNDNAYLGRAALGFDSQIGTIIPMPTGEIIAFAFDRWRSAGLHSKVDIDVMNRLHPHMARSGMISARLGLQRAAATTDTLQAISLPAAVLSSSARVLATNVLFDGLTHLVMPVAFGRIAINEIAANRLFQRALEESSWPEESVVRSIPVVEGSNRPACVIHLIPLRRNVQDLFPGGDVLVAITTLRKRSMSPSADVLISLFDLTAAEARFAVALAADGNVKEASRSVSITEKSGRTYLERVFAKTGTSRQSELLALLNSAHPFT